MAAEIERIVDRKLIKARVHYLVVWRGFGEENNTWESRIDLVADGYGAVIKRFEDERKKTDGGATPTRGRSRSRSRSPGRSGSAPKSPRSRSKSGRGPGRPRGRSRSRSASVGRQPRKAKAASPSKSDNQEESKPKAEPARRSTRHASKEQQPEEDGVVETTTTTTQFVTRLETKKAGEEDDDALLLRSTLAALSTPVVREQTVVEAKVMESSSSAILTTTTSKTVTLAYEEETRSEKTAHEEEEVILFQPAASTAIARGSLADVLTKMTEGGWLVSFLSVAAVVGSIVAFQVLPRDGNTETAEIGRRWLPALTPIVSLLLFFHQKDTRSSAKWVAIALAWRCAAELLLLIGETPADFHSVVLFAGGIANTALVVAFATMVLRRKVAESISSAVLLTVGALALFLADSWFVTTANGALESRVILMSLAVLVIALSPVPVSGGDEE